MASFISARKSGIILTGIFMAPLFSQGAGIQSVRAQSSLTDATDSARNKFYDLVFSKYGLKIIGSGLLAVIVIVSLVFLLKNTSNEEDYLKQEFEKFCNKIVNFLDEGDAKVERKEDFIKVTYPDGGYASISIKKEDIPINKLPGEEQADCIFSFYENNGKGEFGLKMDDSPCSFSLSKEKFEEIVIRKRNKKPNVLFENISKTYKNEMTVKLKGGVFAVFLKNGINVKMFASSVDYTRTGGKFFAPLVVSLGCATCGTSIKFLKDNKKKYFNRFSDAKKYFDELLFSMKKDNLIFEFKEEN